MLGWSLIFVMIVAVSLPVYFLVEPERQVSADEAFLERSRSVARRSSRTSRAWQYDATKSLLCANCHGLQGQGGTAPFVLQPEADICLIEQNKGNANVPRVPPEVT